jgi:hypothetical protein
MADYILNDCGGSVCSVLFNRLNSLNTSEQWLWRRMGVADRTRQPRCGIPYPHVRNTGLDLSDILYNMKKVKFFKGLKILEEEDYITGC